MKKTKRRDFLKQFFWGSALLYVNPITFSTSGKAITDKANNLPTDEITRKQALTYFYKKEYKNAENLFNKLISVHPDKISYYDGLRKVLGAQNRISDICVLYAEGLKKNQDNPVFYDRYARALTALSGGNKIQRSKYEQETGIDPVDYSLKLYIEAISKFPDKQYLKTGLLDIQKKIGIYTSSRSRVPIHQPDTAILSKIPELTSEIKELWEHSRTSIKKNSPINKARHIGKTATTPPKKRRAMFFPEEEQLRAKQITAHLQWVTTITLSNLLQNPVYKTVYTYISTLSPNLITDSLFGEIKKYAKQYKLQKFLIELTQNRYNRSKTFWRTISYADSLKQNKDTASQAFVLYQEAEKKNKALQPKKIGALYGGKATCLIQEKKYSSAREILLQGIELLNGIGGVARGLSIHYAKTYISEENYEAAENILNLILTKCLKHRPDTEEFPDDPIIKYIYPDPFINEEISFYHRLDDKQPVHTQEILSVYYALARLYIKKNDSAGYSRIKNKIIALSPQDRFVNNNHI